MVHRDGRDTEPAGEARRRKPTREVCSSSSEWTQYGGRWCDLIGQLECGLEVLIGWEPHTRTHARMVFPERSITRSLMRACLN